MDLAHSQSQIEPQPCLNLKLTCSLGTNQYSFGDMGTKLPVWGPSPGVEPGFLKGGGGAEISHRRQLYVYRAVCNIEFIVASFV